MDQWLVPCHYTILLQQQDYRMRRKSYRSRNGFQSHLQDLEKVAVEDHLVNLIQRVQDEMLLLCVVECDQIVEAGPM